jgi:hypothetical protein
MNNNENLVVAKIIKVLLQEQEDLNFCRGERFFCCSPRE